MSFYNTSATRTLFINTKDYWKSALIEPREKIETDMNDFTEVSVDHNFEDRNSVVYLQSK